MERGKYLRGVTSLEEGRWSPPEGKQKEEKKREGGLMGGCGVRSREGTGKRSIFVNGC